MSKRLRHVFSRSRFSAAEAVLSVVALVLVIWLLWPESQSPKLNQQSAWLQQLEEAEVRRSKQLAERKPDSEAAVRRGVTQSFQANDKPERRTLAKPSELADRLDQSARAQPAAMPVARGDMFEQAVLSGKTSDFEQELFDVAIKVGVAPKDAKAAETVASALEDVKPDDPTTSLVTSNDQPAPPSSDPVELPKPEIKVAVYSSEALDSQSSAEQPLVDSKIAPDAEGFEVESSASTHVRQRPRDDAPSWLRNAVTASLVDDRPVIAVVIDDLGLNRSNTKALNALPAPLTLAFLPYAGKIEAQTDAAREAGHELMVHLPMEPFGSQWPGPGALVTSLDHDEFIERLEANLNRIKGYVGVNNHMGSRLTADRGRMDLVMRELRKRDVLFLDSKTSARSVAGEMASRNGVPNTTRDVFLDHVIDIDRIRHQMALIERIARRTGSAVAIGHPHTATIEAMKEWLPKLEQRGFTLAPLSAVIARRACHDELLITAKTCGRYLLAQKPNAPSAAAGGG